MEFNAEEKTFVNAEKMREYTYNACKEKIYIAIERGVFYGRARLDIIDWPKDVVLSLINELKSVGYYAGHHEFKYLVVVWNKE